MQQVIMKWIKCPGGQSVGQFLRISVKMIEARW